MQAKESLVSYVLLLFASVMFESTLAQDLESTVNCASGPCQHSGSCREHYIDDTFVGYDCFCRRGFSGKNCEIRDISSSTETTPTTTMYYTGEDIRASYCSMNTPCQNGGTCTDGATESEYECKCHVGFKGKDCQYFETKMAPTSTKSSTVFRASYCSLNTPCQNGGSCTDAATDSEYQCKCPVGFEGKDCQYLTEQPEETREIVLTDDSCERKISVGIPQVKYMATLICEEGTIYIKSVVYGAGKHWNAWIEQIGKICNYKTQCKVAAKDDMFDDPFTRVYKRLIIVYDCGTMPPKSSDPGRWGF